MRFFFRSASRVRAGFTLVELLVVVAISAVLVALLLPAIHKVREATNRTECLNHLKQISLALHGYHDVHQTFPHAYDSRALFIDPSKTPLTPARTSFIVTKSWATLILPFIEQALLENAGYAYYHEQDLPVFLCPSDRRTLGYYMGNKGFGQQGLTDYLAVTGTDTLPTTSVAPRCNGVMYGSSRTRLADITDGASTTVLVGERPPSPDLFWGWWTWSAFDASLGVRNSYPVYGVSGASPPTPCVRLFPENYRPNDSTNCDAHHFWSTHPGGGNWVFADGSVRFLPYSANPLLPALATRNGGEAVSDGGGEI